MDSRCCGQKKKGYSGGDGDGCRREGRRMRWMRWMRRRRRWRVNTCALVWVTCGGQQVAGISAGVSKTPPAGRRVAFWPMWRLLSFSFSFRPSAALGPLPVFQVHCDLVVLCAHSEARFTQRTSKPNAEAGQGKTGVQDRFCMETVYGNRFQSHTNGASVISRPTQSPPESHYTVVVRPSIRPRSFDIRTCACLLPLMLVSIARPI